MRVRFGVLLRQIIVASAALFVAGLAQGGAQNTPGALPPALARWMDYEQNYIVRTVNAAKIMPPTIAAQNVAYRPETGNWFDLPSIWVPSNKLNVAEAAALIPSDLRPLLTKKEGGVEYFRLFVHPESKKFYRKLWSRYSHSTDFRATATASSRTLLVESVYDPKKLFFVKVSLAVNLGGVKRTVLRDETVRGVGTTIYLNQVTPNLSPVFRFMPEVLGIIPKGWGEGGQLIRLIPPEVLNGKSSMMPLFALYSKRGDGTLLQTMATKAGLSPRNFLITRILKPFSSAWVNWAARGPVTMEAHAQNVLLEIGNDSLPTGRLFMRDLGGFEIDMDAPSFDPAWKSRLPLFTKLDADYFPKSASQMQRESLDTYFSGGFLYNVDLELTRVEPGYVKGTIFDDFYGLLGAQLAAQTGLPAILMNQRRIESQTPLLVRLAEMHAAIDLSRRCGLRVFLESLEE